MQIINKNGYYFVLYKGKKFVSKDKEWAIKKANNYSFN